MVLEPRKPSVSITELAARWEISYETARRMVSVDHRFPGAHRIGGRWRIPVEDVRAYEAGQLEEDR